MHRSFIERLTSLWAMRILQNISEDSMLFSVRHVSVSIQRLPAAVYEYASKPENLTSWAGGLAGDKVHREGDFWISESPMGRVKIRFAPVNTLGVIDHDVTLPDGETTHNAFRVLPNGDGSEVIFSVFKGKLSDEQFEQDAGRILKDLEKLKSILEK